MNETNRFSFVIRTIDKDFAVLSVGEFIITQKNKDSLSYVLPNKQNKKTENNNQSNKTEYKTKLGNKSQKKLELIK